LLLSISYLQAKLDIGYLGIIHSLPVLFYIAVIIILISFLGLCFFSNNSKWLMYVQLLVIVIAIYLTPFLLEGTPRYGATFWNYGMVDYLYRIGYTSPSEITYHSWPGFSFQVVSLLNITGITNPEPVMALYPFVVEIIYVLIILALFSVDNDKSPGTIAWIAALIFILGNWTYSNYFSPQSSVYILILCFILVLVWLNRKQAGNLSEKILLIILFSSIVLTHLLTSLIVLLTLAVLIVFYFIRYRKFRWIDMLLLTATLFMGWTIYGASYQLKMNLPLVIQEILRLDLLLEQLMGRIVETSVQHQTINTIRVVYTGVIALVGILGFVLNIKHRGWQIAGRILFGLAVAVILILPLLFYGGEMIVRAYIFLLPFVIFYIAYLIVKYMKKPLAAVFIAIALIAVVPCSLITLYGNETLEYIHPGELRAADFYYGKARSGFSLTYNPMMSCRFPERFRQVPIADTPEQYLDLRENIENNHPDYIGLNKYTNSLFTYIAGKSSEVADTEEWLNRDTVYSLIYNNKVAKIYTVK